MGTSTFIGLEDLHIEEHVQHYIFGSIDKTSLNQQKYTPISILDGIRSEIDRDHYLDTYSASRDITAPGAMLVLGLM